MLLIADGSFSLQIGDNGARRKLIHRVAGRAGEAGGVNAPDRIRGARSGTIAGRW